MATVYIIASLSVHQRRRARPTVSTPSREPITNRDGSALSEHALTVAAYGHDPVGKQSLCPLILTSSFCSPRCSVSTLSLAARPCSDWRYGRANKKEERRHRSAAGLILELPQINVSQIVPNRPNTGRKTVQFGPKRREGSHPNSSKAKWGTAARGACATDPQQWDLPRCNGNAVRHRNRPHVCCYTSAVAIASRVWYVR